MSAWVRGNLLWKGKIFKKKSEIPQNDLTKPNIEGIILLHITEREEGSDSQCIGYFICLDTSIKMKRIDAPGVTRRRIRLIGAGVFRAETVVPIFLVLIE